jgi:hypothetical protein
VRDRDFRALFDEAEWAALRVSVALVCRDATGQRLAEDGWAHLAGVLAHIGTHAAGLAGGKDLALRLLTDFGDQTSCRNAVAVAQALVAELPDPALRAMTEQAAALVDRAAPDQAFRFRATLILVSMLAGEAAGYR